MHPYQNTIASDRDLRRKYMYQEKFCRYLKEKKTCNIEKNKYHTFEILALVLLVMMAMDFKTRVYYISFVLFGLIVVLRHKELCINRVVIPSIVLAVSMCLFSKSLRNDELGIIRPIAFPMCILIGYNLVEPGTVSNVEKKVKWIIIALAIGSYGHYLLNMLNNLGKNVDRNTIDYWTSSPLSATGQSALSGIMLGTAISYVFSNTKPILRIIYTGVILSVLYYNLILGGRMVFVLAIVMIICNLLGNWYEKKTINKRIQGLLVVSFVTITIYLVIKNNVFGIVDVFNNSNFYQRFFGENSAGRLREDNRLLYKSLYINNMMSYPFGGDELRQAVGNHFAHDIILDTYSDAGFFAAIAIIVMIINTIRRCISLHSISNVSYLTKRIIYNVSFAIFSIFMLEAILEGVPWFFMCFCVIYGAIARLVSQVEQIM